MGVQCITEVGSTGQWLGTIQILQARRIIDLLEVHHAEPLLQRMQFASRPSAVVNVNVSVTPGAQQIRLFLGPSEKILLVTRNGHRVSRSFADAQQ